MYLRRASPIEQNPNMSSGNTPPVRLTLTGERESSQNNLLHTGQTVAPRPTAIRHEGQSPFMSATSHVQPEESSARDIAMRISPGIPNRDETSPSPHWEGQQLVSSNPPSRTASQTGETMRINSPLDSHGDKRAPARRNPMSISMELLITPTIWFSALDGIISVEQSIGLSRLIAHHALQRQKLVGVGHCFAWQGTRPIWL